MSPTIIHSQFLDANFGDNVTVFPNAQIGRPLLLPKDGICTVNNTDYSRTQIGDNTVIGCNTVIFVGVTIGKNVLIGDNVVIREGAKIGDNCIIGTGSGVGPYTVIGNKTKIMDMSHITGYSIIGNNVFIAAGVTTSNDNSMGETYKKYGYHSLLGAIIEDNVKIGIDVAILPGIRIGENSIIGANTTVTKDIPPNTKYIAIPGSYRITRMEILNDKI
jgi:acetyltransferase-like isoleucine patch superfamily enzyme